MEQELKLLRVLVKDKELYNHCYKTGVYFLKLLEKCKDLFLVEYGKIEYELISVMAYGASIHDIGKLFLPERILYKAGLSEEEFNMFKTHPIIGSEYLAGVLAGSNKSREILINIVRSHHERWDGKGYPDGLKGEDIPLYVRAVTIADAYDAMVSERIYKYGVSNKTAIDELKKCGGTQFDPYLIDLIDYDTFI